MRIDIGWYISPEHTKITHYFVLAFFYLNFRLYIIWIAWYDFFHDIWLIWSFKNQATTNIYTYSLDLLNHRSSRYYGHPLLNINPIIQKNVFVTTLFYSLLTPYSFFSILYVYVALLNTPFNPLKKKHHEFFFLLFFFYEYRTSNSKMRPF